MEPLRGSYIIFILLICYNLWNTSGVPGALELFHLF
jgi:hypothetical protein